VRAVSDGTIAQRIDLLVRGKAEFLRFLERRLRSRADAEDVLQRALLKVVAHEMPLREAEKLIPWFYQILRNLVVDQYRHNAAFRRLQDQVAAEADTATEIDEELFQATYPCVNDVAATLKPEYGELIRRVELADEPLHEVARELASRPTTPLSDSTRPPNPSRRVGRHVRGLRGACLP